MQVLDRAALQEALRNADLEFLLPPTNTATPGEPLFSEALLTAPGPELSRRVSYETSTKTLKIVEHGLGLLFEKCIQQRETDGQIYRFREKAGQANETETSSLMIEAVTAARAPGNLPRTMTLKAASGKQVEARLFRRDPVLCVPIGGDIERDRVLRFLQDPRHTAFREYLERSFDAFKWRCVLAQLSTSVAQQTERLGPRFAAFPVIRIKRFSHPAEVGGAFPAWGNRNPTELIPLTAGVHMLTLDGSNEPQGHIGKEDNPSYEEYVDGISEDELEFEDPIVLESLQVDQTVITRTGFLLNWSTIRNLATAVGAEGWPREPPTDTRALKTTEGNTVVPRDQFGRHPIKCPFTRQDLFPDDICLLQHGQPVRWTLKNGAALSAENVSIFLRNVRKNQESHARRLFLSSAEDLRALMLPQRPELANDMAFVRMLQDELGVQIDASDKLVYAVPLRDVIGSGRKLEFRPRPRDTTTTVFESGGENDGFLILRVAGTGENTITRAEFAVAGGRQPRDHKAV